MVPLLLTIAMFSNMYMADEPCQQRPEGRASEPSPRPAAKVCGTAGAGRAAGPDLLHLAAASLSLPPASATAQGPRPRGRSQGGVHREVATHLDGRGQTLRGRPATAHQRGGRAGPAGPVA